MFDLTLLGRVELRDAAGGECRRLLERPKLLALLVYLALARPRGFHRRDRIAAIFWPEVSQARARNALRQAVHHLRAALGAETLRSRGDEELAIDRDRLQCDVVVFEELVATGRESEALDLVRGELLPSFHLTDAADFEQWLEGERAEVRRQAAAAACSLAQRDEQRDNPLGTVRWARRALEFAPYDEQVMRQLLGALDRAGDRADAVEEYQKFARRLELDLGVAPAPETQSRVSAVRTRADAGRNGAASHVSPPSAVQPLAAPLASKTTLPPQRTRAWLAALAGAAAVLVVMTALWALWPGRGTGGAVSDGGRPTLVVLPIEDRSTDPLPRHYANGLTLELIREFARFGQIRVLSGSSVMRIGSTPLPQPSIADSLRANYVLECGVEHGGGRIRLVARLTHAQTDARVWSTTYDRDTREVLALQRDLARQVVRALAIEPGRLPRDDRPPPNLVDPDVYDLYLLGVSDANSLAVRPAIEAFEQAIAMDSMFAPAHAALASAYSRQVYFDLAPLGDGARKAEDAARRALVLDESLVDAHVALGMISALSWEWSGAEREFERAVELSPSDAGARRVYAWYLCLVGRYDAAVRQVREVRRLDPLSWETGAPLEESLVCERR